MRCFGNGQKDTESCNYEDIIASLSSIEGGNSLYVIKGVAALLVRGGSGGGCLSSGGTDGVEDPWRWR